MKIDNEVVKSYEGELYFNDEPYYVHYDITWNCYTDGIGSYEYWGQKCYDEGSFCADLLEIKITKVYEFEGNEIEISDEVKKEFEDTIEKYAEYDDD